MFNLILKLFIRLYQKVISPFLMPACRFYPSCSEYAIQALNHCNIFKAVGLITLRLFKCHPWHAGGHDPIKSSQGE